MGTIITTSVSAGQTIASATFNANFAAVQDVVNGDLDQYNFAASAVLPPSLMPGVAVVRGPYAFAYNTASINSGVTVYTPTAEDILLDAWIEITTAFNGTTPKADIGSFSGTTSGLFNLNGNPVVLSTADTTSTGGAGISVNVTAETGPLAAQIPTKRAVPSRFTAATPIKLVVSQDGLSGGAAIGGSTGAGKLYIVTATPKAF